MKYFGTDGIRGVYGEGMTEDLAYRAGRALAAVVGGRAFVARDTRSSGPAIEGALAAGISAGGADVCAAGVLPTPAVSLLTAERGCSFGVEISASHNPPEYNGLKVFTPDGRKLPASAERAVEYYMDNAPPVSGGGVRAEWSGGAEAYAEYVLARVKELAAATGRPSDLRGLRVLLDCGGGAGTEAAKRVFGALGAETGALCDDCRGECINVRCGALHPEAMCAAAGAFDISFAFDGDADRLAVCGRRLYHGDEILFNLTRFPFGGVVVGTLMTNSALERRLSAQGMRLLRTDVGDRNIAEVMRVTGARLGGEPSGHYIAGGVTGDGILSAAAVSLLAASDGLYTLACDAQASADIPLLSGSTCRRALADAECAAKRLARRVVIRPSGTEPVLRVMAEGGDAEGAVALVREMLG